MESTKTNEQFNTEEWEKLKSRFGQVFEYLGDDELLSSCNDEYSLEYNNFILTDGVYVQSMGAQTDEDGHPMIGLTTSIRGAAYVIIGERDDDKVNVNVGSKPLLYVDTSKLNDMTIEKIKNSLQVIHKNYESVHYYVYEWNKDDLPNPVDPHEVL